MHKAIIILISVIVNSLILSGQENDSSIFKIVEDMPTYKGGDINNFRVYVQENLIYPKYAYEQGIYGKVFVTFTVDVNSNVGKQVSNIHVVRGVHPSLDFVAIKLISNAPELWNSGKARGRSKPTTFTMPVIFNIENSVESQVSNVYDNEIVELLSQDSLTIDSILYLNKPLPLELPKQQTTSNNDTSVIQNIDKPTDN
jgi:hypothetical protein